MERAQKEAEEAIKKMQAQGIDPQKVTPEEMASKMMSGKNNDKNYQSQYCFNYGYLFC